MADSITITNTNSRISINGKTYYAYKLFDSTHTGTAYSYTMSTSNQFYSAALLGATEPADGVAKVLWNAFTFTAVPGDTSKVNVAAKSGFDARDFADDMEAFLAAATPDGSKEAANNTATIDNLTSGYYLVTGTADATDQATGATGLVSAVILTNENPNPVVNPKVDAPTLNKKITGVAEGTTVVNGAVLDNDGVAAVAKIGSTVSFELDAVVPDLTGYDDYTYTFHDTMSDGLTFVTDSFNLAIGNDTTVDIDPTITGQSFVLTIPYNTLKNYTADTAVVLTYNATVNSTAVTYDKENNTAYLEYSNNPYDDTTDHTPDKKVYVIDINLDVDKVNAAGDKLTGAKFKLYKEVAGANAGDPATKLYYKWDNNVVTWVAEANADVFETENGALKQQIRGLDKGTYYLVETEAPTGYNLLSAPVEIVISVSEANDKVTYTATYDGSDATMTNGAVDLTTETTNNKQPVATGTVLNNSGTVLPGTGGIGTTLFYVAGIVLVLGAAAVIIARRKAEQN